MQDRFDYVVIGGGTAGCVVAGRLSENPGVQVLLLERGQDTTEDARLIPPTYDSVLARQWRAWFATTMKGIYHMAGTCKMGPPEDPMSVVDSQLRLRGVPNLRIADCSIMPRVVASHPSASAVMIGEKLAAMVKLQA